MAVSALAGLRGSAQEACPPGQERNRKGNCVCPPGTNACPDGCFDLRVDLSNCGACGQTCVGGECLKGGCRCPEGTELCNGVCLDPTTYPTDPNNCGTCGNVCVGGVCDAGRCLAPNGFSCAADTECISGICAAGICCNRACDGSCQSCALLGNEGTCTSLADGTACPGSGSGNRCENPATCASGVCVDRSPVVCTQVDGSCTKYVCEPSTGECVGEPKVNGTQCDNGRVCVTDQTCFEGVCGGGTPVTCFDPPPCKYFPSFCSEASGGCVYTNRQNYSSCGDNGEYCWEGYCLPCIPKGQGICPADRFACCSFSCQDDPLNPGYCCNCD